MQRTPLVPRNSVHPRRLSEHIFFVEVCPGMDDSVSLIVSRKMSLGDFGDSELAGADERDRLGRREVVGGKRAHPLYPVPQDIYKRMIAATKIMMKE
jgi:hypothetical protein